MLGGDNIDLALAHHVEKKLGGARLDAEQWSALRFACRTAKEKLLGEQQPAVERWPVTIAGRGSRLIGGSIQSELTRAEVEAIALDGFFPRVTRGEDPAAGGQDRPAGVRPAVRRRSGRAQASGLLPAPAPGRGDRAGGPPAGGPARAARRDPVQRRGADARDRPPPDRRGDHARGSPTIPGRRSCPRVLTNISLDLAVAQGAAYYGVVRRGGGIRIGGGTARSFYVGLETDRGRQALALRRAARCPGGRRDRDRRPRFRPLDGPAGGLPAGQQLGPARRQAGRPGRSRPRLDPRASAACKA